MITGWFRARAALQISKSSAAADRLTSIATPARPCAHPPARSRACPPAHNKRTIAGWNTRQGVRAVEWALVITGIFRNASASYMAARLRLPIPGNIYAVAAAVVLNGMPWMVNASMAIGCTIV